MTDQTSQPPSASDVLDNLLQAINDSLQVASSVVRGEEQDLGDGRRLTPSMTDRLTTAHHIIESGAPLAKRLLDLQKNRRHPSAS